MFIEVVLERIRFLKILIMYIYVWRLCTEKRVLDPWSWSYRWLLGGLGSLEKQQTLLIAESFLFFFF